MAGSNALISQKARPAPEHPMMLHAKAWRHVGGMPSDQLASKSKELDYALPILGALAGNPNVTPKDVIKAAASAAADGALAPDQAVQMISAMPADPTKVQPWLKQLYAANLSAQVHMKAAMMQQAQPRQAQPQQAPAAPPQAMPT